MPRNSAHSRAPLGQFTSRRPPTRSLHRYADLAKELLAIPTVRGLKSPTERFAGAEATYTIEALMQNNWALQSGTSHFLGQNFARAFDVNFQNADNQQELVWATSWGVSTRLIGALVMTHSDDAGLVLPPAVAPTQVVVVPISPKGPTKDPEGHAALMAYVDRAVGALKAAGVRVDVDDRFNLKPGPKFYEAERRGIPLRIECGPRDIEANWSQRMKDTHRPVYGDDLQPMWDGAVDAWAAIFAERGGDVCQTQAQAIKCPTLVLHGAKDPMCLSEHPEWFVDNIPDARLHIFPDGKHNIHIKFADEFNALVRAFVLNNERPD